MPRDAMNGAMRSVDTRKEWTAENVTHASTAISSGTHTVKSYDRPGLVFVGLKNKTGVTLAVNDKVSFYAFNDGTGAMIDKL